MSSTRKIEKKKNFFLKRLIRLIPLYWGLTIFTFLVAQFIPSIVGYKPTITELIKSMFFVPYARESLKSGITIRPLVGLGHTLQMEIMFSLFFAISMIISHKNRGIISAIICAIFALIGSFVEFKNPFFKFYLTDNVNTWITFMSGVLTYCLLSYIADKKIKIKNKPSLMVSGSLAIVAIIISQIYQQEIKSLFITPYISIIIFFLILIFAILYSIWELPIPQFLVRLGDMSFSYYLLHYYFVSFGERILCINSFTIINMFLIALILIVAWLFSYVSWYFIENKFSKYLISKLIK